MPLAANDKVELKLYCKSEGQYSINTLHYVVAAIAGASVSEAFALQALDTFFHSLLKDCMSVEAEYLGASLQVVKPTRLPKHLNTDNAGDGTFAGDVLPRQVAGLIKKGTNFAGRHEQGRMFVPFPSEDCNSTDGFPSIAYKEKLSILAEALKAGVLADNDGDTATLIPIIYNRATGDGHTVVTTAVRNVWGTCRRRADVRGNDRSPF